MKKIILLFVVLVSSVGISHAQPGQGQRMSLEEREKRMAETLGLDEAQQTKMSAINAKYSGEFSEIRQKMRNADEAGRAELFPKMRELNEKKNKEIRSILNEEQATKFDEMLKQREERMKKMRMRDPGERGGDKRPGK